MSDRPILSDETIADATQLIEMALREDVGSSDIEEAIDCTTNSVVPGDAQAAASFVSRESGIVCGVAVAELARCDFALRDARLGDSIGVVLSRGWQS